MIAEIEMHERDWAVIFFSEVDAYLKELPAMEFGDHLAHRIYPGAGSVAFLVLVHKKFKGCLHSFEARGRSCRLHFQSAKADWSQTVVCIHGGHGVHLGQSLSDATFLCRKAAKRTPLLVVGDINVDQLPTLSVDPYGSDCSRGGHHAVERGLLHGFMDAHNLEVQIPSTRGMPGGDAEINEACLSAPISRVPLGGSIGRPSLLDYSMSRISEVSSRLSWDLQHGDHAMFCV